jgi:hypothetical protein
MRGFSCLNGPGTQALNKTLTDAVKRFVRDELGCTCPASVFETVDIVRSPAWFSGLPADYLLAIGNRLLVLVVRAGTGEDPQSSIEQLLLRGRALRERGGYNRFRLVIETPASATPRPLPPSCRALLSSDARLHVHYVPAGGLPRLGMPQSTVD